MTEPSIDANRQMKTCPSCAEPMQAAAIVCQHCGRRFKAHAERRVQGAVVFLAAMSVFALLVYLVSR